MQTVGEGVASLKAAFPGEILGESAFRDQTAVWVRPARILDILRFLKSPAGGDFTHLSDVCGVDYLGQDDKPERFAVAYHLYSRSGNAWLRISAFLPETDPVVDSAHEIFRSAPWAEREAYDMYGIRFRNHPDLRRILMPEDYPGHPLRKDYPLKGRGERDNFPRYRPVEDV